MKAVLFDLDGTLVDTALDFYHILNALLAEQGRQNLDFLALRLWVADGADALISRSFHIKPEDPNFAPLKERFLNKYEAELGQHAKPFPGVEALLATLETQHIPWGVVTNKNKRFTDRLLKQLAFSERTQCIISGDSIPERKPNPAPLLAACELLQVKPTESVYIGDGQRDIEAGKRAGMKTIAALYGYIAPELQTVDWGQDSSVQDVVEIANILTSWGYLTKEPEDKLG